MTLPEIQHAIAEKKIGILVPTYNNQKTLARVLDGILDFTDKILVVNDGSTDATAEILKQYPQLTIISLDKNQGKGNALKIGFRKMLDLGLEYAITIDSDGQHYPDDIPVFVDALQKESEDVLLIGNRNMSQDGIPGKSSFGNRFSNFWFWFETGIKLQDTQSGFRLYPLKKIPKKYYTPKFEFEIEIIVRAAWKGIPVKNVPIKVLYDPAERVSHFRPFKDFTRISILNTILVFVAIFVIKPRDFFRNFKKKSFKQFLKEDVFESEGSNRKKAISIALGVFIGLSPVWGFQTVLTMTLAVVFRLNKILAFTFSHISFPPLIPLVIWLSLLVGAPFVGGNTTFSQAEMSFDLIKMHLFQYVVGSLLLATTTSVLFGVLSFFLLERFSPQNEEPAMAKKYPL